MRKVGPGGLSLLSPHTYPCTYPLWYSAPVKVIINMFMMNKNINIKRTLLPILHSTIGKKRNNLILKIKTQIRASLQSFFLSINGSRLWKNFTILSEISIPLASSSRLFKSKVLFFIYCDLRFLSSNLKEGGRLYFSRFELQIMTDIASCLFSSLYSFRRTDISRKKKKTKT